MKPYGVKTIKDYPDWISVDDRLPEEGDRVLSYSNGGMMQRDYIYRNKWESYDRGYNVTHWMPLPKPPQE